jgi:5S rRNA maturation endonuclease (ribonuclease M5)
MKNLHVDFAKQTIQMTKTYATKAGKVGSREYDELTKIHQMYPDYRFVITAPKTNSPAKGLDYNFMEKYIAALSDEKRKEELAQNYQDLRDADLSYGEIRTWFVETFEEFKNCKCKADVILALRKAQVEQKAKVEETKANEIKAEDVAA